MKKGKLLSAAIVAMLTIGGGQLHSSCRKLYTGRYHRNRR